MCSGYVWHRASLGFWRTVGGAHLDWLKNVLCMQSFLQTDNCYTMKLIIEKCLKTLPNQTCL